ncbi:helix-turn-helix domain-containing protein [Actinokineospora sp.]|uniref:helix-turn-helix domain-containing protein n=1 Tax=Actinokineospora sp. TaxID=1872133 RepID=UPI003D6AB3C7
MPTPETRINGAAMRAIRERMDLTVTALADEVEAIMRKRDEQPVRRRQINKIECGTTGTTWAVARAIASALRVPVVAIVADPAAHERASA